MCRFILSYQGFALFIQVWCMEYRRDMYKKVDDVNWGNKKLGVDVC